MTTNFTSYCTCWFFISSSENELHITESAHTIPWGFKKSTRSNLLVFLKGFLSADVLIKRLSYCYSVSP